MWCPNCQNEYKAGIVICPECNLPLIEELVEEKEKLAPVAAFKDEEIKNRIRKYLSSLNIDNDEETGTDEEGETTYTLLVPESMIQKALHIISAIVKVEAEKRSLELAEQFENDPEAFEESEGSGFDEETEQRIRENKEAIDNLRKMNSDKGFIKASDRSSDYIASGRLFAGLGVLLLIFAILNIAGTLSMVTALYSQIILCAFGVALIIYGIISVRKGSGLVETAKEEEVKEEEIKQFLKDSVTVEKLEAMNDDDTTPELLYLKQSDYVKEVLTNEYPDLNDEYADMLVNDFMNDLYND